MADQSPDDVFALYSHFDLDREHYRVFPREAASKTAVLVEPVQTSSAAAEERGAITFLHDQIRPAHGNSAHETTAPQEETLIPPHRAPAPIKDFEPDNSRTALQSLLRHVASERHVPIGKTAQALASASLDVYGVAGGVGATTVAAVITRLFAKTGRRCGIFDETEDPTLPIFFGAQKISEDHRRFSGLRSIFEPRIRILHRQMFEPAEKGAGGSSGFIERSFVSMAGQFDHLIFDQPAREGEPTGAGVGIYVAVPDLRSLAALQQVKRKTEASADQTKSVCVLNRFEPASALHKEVLGWCRENFLNLSVISECSLVSEALAEGTTVLDWAPDSIVSTDFLNLFAAVSRFLSFEPERVPLCS